MLERKTREIIKRYTESLTIRQVFYLLVSEQIINNNRSEYVYYDKIITQARQKDLDLAEYFEDRTRNIYDDITQYYSTTKFNKKIRNQIYQVKNDYPTYYYNRNTLQDKITIILLEKRSLERIFKKAVYNYPHILVVGGGFTSFSQMKDLKNLVLNEMRELNLYTFTDFDDSGILLQDNFLYQMKQYLKVDFDYIERVALTLDQIESMNLPQNPTKKSTHSKYNLPFFVELDAIEPNTLTNMIKEVCELNFDKELYDNMKKALGYRNRRLKKAYFKQLKKIDLSKI